MFASLRRWTRTDAPTEEQPVSAAVAAMDRGGISRMLISAWVAPRNVMISNDEVASFVAEAPDRLTGVGSVDISRPMEAVREVRRCARELGFKAIRVLPWLWEAPPTDRRFYPVYVGRASTKVAGAIINSDCSIRHGNGASIRNIGQSYLAE